MTESILLPTEIEFYVDTMQVQEMENIGSVQWLEWHQRLQKLNQEAIIEVSSMKEEYVKESFVSFGKISVLIHEAILINIWKHKVLPHLLKLEPHPESTMIAYSILYHEAVCVSLLELVIFHENCCEAMEYSSLDLLDYACGLASQLVMPIKYEKSALKETIVQELTRQRNNLTFDMAIRSLSIIRYICEKMHKLPLTVSSNIYIQHDIPALFIAILRSKAWIENDCKQYSSGKWKEWDGEALCDAEAQIWLTLRFILLDELCPQYYPITESRRIQLLNLSSHLTPVILDQLSPLIELKQWLGQISLMHQPCAPHKPILIENCLEMKKKIIRQTGGKWKELAKLQIDVIFNNEKNHLVETAKILNEAFNTDLLEKFNENDKMPCSRCGTDSVQRCSRCKKIWYCSRKCQVLHWPQHKDNCSEFKS